MELPPAQELKKRLREEKQEKPKLVFANDIEAGFAELVAAFTEAKTDQFLVRIADSQKFPSLSRLSGFERQEVLAKIAKTPGYYVCVHLPQTSNTVYVPSHVWEWEEIYLASADDFAEIEICLDEEE